MIPKLGLRALRATTAKERVQAVRLHKTGHPAMSNPIRAAAKAEAPEWNRVLQDVAAVAPAHRVAVAVAEVPVAAVAVAAVAVADATKSVLKNC